MMIEEWITAFAIFVAFAQGLLLGWFLWRRPKLTYIDHTENNYEGEHCPVCGYYCLGKGGIGCIDKPFLTGFYKE